MLLVTYRRRHRAVLYSRFHALFTRRDANAEMVWQIGRQDRPRRYTVTFVPSFLDALPDARRALAYARELHAEQRRDSDAAAFILHPLEVAAALHIAGYHERVVIAGLLHDTIEDTEARRTDLAARFGESAAELVCVLTEDPSLEPYEVRKRDLRERAIAGGADAIAVVAADKVIKVRELRTELSTRAMPPTEHQRKRYAHYEECLAMLEVTEPLHSFVQQLRFELETLRGLPPGVPSDP